MMRRSLLFLTPFVLMCSFTTLQAQDNYQPCPANPEPCAIMPLGASITFGMGSSDYGGYRKPLFQRAWAEDKNITFVGNMLSGPSSVDGHPFPLANEGHSGYLIQSNPERAGILELTEDSLRWNNPHIVLVFVGTNDAVLNYRIEEAGDRMGRLLDRIADVSPNTLVVLGKLTLSRDDAISQRIRTINASFDRVVSDRVARGKHILLVDMQEIFPAHSGNWKNDFLSDDIHPNDAGFHLMSEVWYSAIARFLK